MDSQVKALKKALRERRAELQALIDQMKSDQLQNSSVFHHLETELSNISQKLEENTSQKK